MELLSAILQIFILYLVIYAILKGARGSRFGQALMGVGILATFLFAFTYLFHFYVLALIVRYLLLYIAISTVVIFQPEIRRILATVGALGSFEKSRTRRDGTLTPEAVTDVIMDLAAHRTGALIAFERGISLRGYEGSGVRTDALLSRELVNCIFTPPLPLHDGGVVIRDGRISSAHCIFPVSNKAELIRSGMRHRAAVGLSEETDAMIVVVSEERGTVSVAHNGKLFRYEGATASASVLRWVRKAMLGESRERKFVHKLVESIQQFLAKPISSGRSSK